VTLTEVLHHFDHFTDLKKLYCIIWGFRSRHDVVVYRGQKGCSCDTRWAQNRMPSCWPSLFTPPHLWFSSPNTPSSALVGDAFNQSDRWQQSGKWEREWIL